jgi:DNA/RNA-binding domain of Phe-tRNA-synthetase-like protein
VSAPEHVERSPVAGFIEPHLGIEFPGLRLDWVSSAARRCASPPAVRRRLRSLSNRYRGANVVAMRTQPIPHAYRAFFRQIGLDPDTTRIPSEEVAVARLLQGEFRSTDLVDDALLIALIETGVPVWALDEKAVDAGGLGIRTAVDGDRLGVSEYGSFLRPGTLAVADSRCVHAVLFGEIAPGHEVSSRSSRIVLFAVGVPGVPVIHVEEALWICSEVFGTG